MPFKNKNLARASSRKYYHNAKLKDPGLLTKLNIKARERSIANPAKTIFRNVSKRARERGIPFNLIPSDIIIPEACPVFGTPFVYGSVQTASVDRIDPNKGYSKNNIQIISQKANAMKSNASPEELKVFANWVLSQYTS